MQWLHVSLVRGFETRACDVRHGLRNPCNVEELSADWLGVVNRVYRPSRRRLQLTNTQLQVGLNLQSENFRISFLALSDSETISPFSDKLAEAMEIYNATVEFVHEAGKYIQIVLVFQQKSQANIDLNRCL